MPEAADPYAFNAPQYADLTSEVKAGGAMSPSAHAWFGAPSLSHPAPVPCTQLRPDVYADDQSRKNRGNRPVSDGPPPPPPPPPQQQKQSLPKTPTVAPAAPKAWAPGAPSSANKPAVSGAKPMAGGTTPGTGGAHLPASVAKPETNAKPATSAAKPATAAKPAAKRVEAAGAKPSSAAATTQPATTSAAARVSLFTPRETPRSRDPAQTPRETPRSASRETPRSAAQLKTPRSAAQLNTSRSAVQLGTVREPRPTPSLTSKSACGREAWTTSKSAKPTPSPRPSARGKSMGAAPSASLLRSIGSGDKPPLTSEERELLAAKEHIEKAQKVNAQRRAQVTLAITLP